MFTLENVATAAYVIAALLFILALAGLSKHETARAGISFGIVGMAVALIATIALAIDRKIEPLGEKFDPNLHQAMYEVPDPSVPSGSVVQVIQPGYVIGERILRPAMVAVAKGGPKMAAQVANDNAAGK